uniref:Lipoxygenase domain-containing protein n=1 Tax=Amorphochlora amoebiformis TaxID=1561963 RepID=A0A7S0H403_9EUKA
MIKTFPKKIIEANKKKKGGSPEHITFESNKEGWKNVSNADTKEPKWAPEQGTAHEKIELGIHRFPILKDCHFKKASFKDRMLRRIIRQDTVFPLQDVFIDATNEECQQILKEIDLCVGKALPKPLHTWDEMDSNDALKRLFFYGPGAIFLTETKDEEVRKRLGPFVVDMSQDVNLEVRIGFRKYGVRAHFDAKQNLRCIYDAFYKKEVLPGDKMWAHAKHLLKQNFGMRITFVNHLVQTHLCMANVIVNAMVTSLPPDHPVRRLLTVFTFRTSYINSAAAESLTPEFSMSHRSSALTYKSMRQLMENGVKSCRIFQPFPEGPHATQGFQKLAKHGLFPYLEDGLAYHSTIKRFVTTWLSHADETDAANKKTESNMDYLRNFYGEIYEQTERYAHTIGSYENDPLKFRAQVVELLTQCIFVVTAHHEIVGSLADFASDITFCAPRARIGATRSDLQSFLICAAVAALTSIRTPRLMSKFENLFGKDGFPEWERTCWEGFLDELKGLHEKISKKNETRPWAFRYMDPEVMESSVSI